MSNRFNILRSHSGFGVIQALIASGVTISLFAGLTSLSMTHSKSQKKMAMKFELQDFRNTLAQSLAIPATCKRILTSIPTAVAIGTPAEIKSIELTQNKKIWDSSVGKPEGSTSGLSIESIKFFVDGALPAATDRLIGHLEITPRLESGSFPIAPEILRQIVVVDSANKIIDCISTSIPSCPSGQIYSGIDSSGLPSCISLQCPVGKVISGVGASGIPTCVDETQIALKSWSCPVGQAVRSISSEGVPQCVVISAATSSQVLPSSPSTSPADSLPAKTSSSIVKSPCTGGVFTEPSTDKSNTCTWNVPDAQPGISIGRISGSGGSWVEATCSSSGSGQWDYSYNCPSTKAVFSCSGGGAAKTSPDGSNSCHFSWPDTAAEKTIAISSTNGGTGSATCSNPSGWSFTFSCPNNNSNSPTCAGGGTPNYPSSSGGTPCAFGWPQSNAGTRINLVSTNGVGTATLYCDSSGTWVWEAVCK